MNNLKEKYIKTFFSKLTKKDKLEIYFDYFMWHALSYEKLPSLKEFNAINEFKKHNENEVYVIFEEHNKVLEYKNLTFEKLINEKLLSCDCYIVDKAFNWSFICTHETAFNHLTNKFAPYNIGPFFITNNTQK